MQIGTALRDLMRHMEWADAIVWTAVRKLEGADDPRLAELLNHLHMTQSAFLTAWNDQPFERGFWKDRSLRESEAMARDYHRQAAGFMAVLEDRSLDRVVNLPWAERFAKGAQATTLGETILQITSHSTHHRGQVNTRIREVGGTPPLVDYIAWLWMGRPTAAWPA